MIDLIPYILEHLVIVLVATGISVVIGIVLGIVAYWVRFAAQPILWFSEAVQTIPALALLAILMILFGLGNTTIIAGTYSVRTAADCTQYPHWFNLGSCRN